MSTVNDTYARIDRLLTGAETNIRRIFVASILGLREELDLEALADALQRGDLDSALQLVIDTAERLGAASSVHFVNAGEDTATFLANASVATVSFDRVNERAVSLMRANQLRLVTEFTEDQRATLRQVMTQGIARGLNPIEQAREFRNAVGLTARQTRAVDNYRRLLEQAGRADLNNSTQMAALTRKLRDKRFDGTVRRAVRTLTPLTIAQIDRMVERFYERSVKLRAETIGRTEALRAVHQGVQETFDQAIEQGKINAGDIQQKWNSAGDGRVRDSHTRLNGKTKTSNEVWQGSAGTLRFPGDPLAPAEETVNCRCVVTHRIRRGQNPLG